MVEQRTVKNARHFAPFCDRLQPLDFIGFSAIPGCEELREIAGFFGVG
jgi:hypothetical protein